MSNSRDTEFVVPFREGFKRSIRPRADVSSAGPSTQPPHGHPFDPPTAPRADLNRAPFRPRSSQEPTSSRAHSAQPAPTYLEGKVAQLNGQVKGHDGRISILEAEKTRLKDVEVDVGRISTLEVEVARLKEVEADVARLKRNGNERDEALRGYLVKEAERRRAALEDTEHLLRICSSNEGPSTLSTEENTRSLSSLPTASSLSSLPTSASLVSLGPLLPYPELRRSSPPISPRQWDRNLDMVLKIKRIQELRRERDERRDIETREQRNTETREHRGEWRGREYRGEKRERSEEDSGRGGKTARTGY